MDDIFVHNETEIATNRARGCFCGVGGTHERAHFLDSAFAGNDHLDHGTAADVLDQAVIEGLALMLGIVSRSLLGSDHAELHALDGQAGALDASDNLAHVTIANGVGLEHGISLLDCHCFSFLVIRLATM